MLPRHGERARSRARREPAPHQHDPFTCAAARASSQWPLAVSASCSGDDDDIDAGAAEDTAITGVETFEVDNRDHASTTVDYPQTPPVGGPHHPVWASCGFYEEEIPAERAVHSMEHGAVWVTYQPDLPDDQQSVLAEAADTETYLLASPFPDLSAVVARAWGCSSSAGSSPGWSCSGCGCDATAASAAGWCPPA